ncbi:transcription initiation factor IIB family protein [Natronorubrum daqingense]|uniref:Transcription factor TFIIB repeat-containing protein n=1 Tax=Natronorubrum daqingense TaxID=588898 RepID=A0A1N7G125_9EURY|nr:hypothetical protein [Natronorubrum daqingense]APX98612.1 hypothetical protein BB347_18125 [Natronorubrum daqingense]SIS06146.1 Transcription factor TFIIB repeat-containing protein [Natronorubrum daqingense]
MSTDRDGSTSGLTFPSDAIETALEDLPPGTITEEAKAYARECGQILDTHQYTSGRSPSGLAAASIYLASLVSNHPPYGSGEARKLSQEEAAAFFGVSQVTVREHYRNILEIRSEHAETISASGSGSGSGSSSETSREFGLESESESDSASDSDHSQRGSTATRGERR